MKIPASSKPHRDTQRTNAALEVVTGSTMYFSPIAALPPKLSQVIVGGYSFFKPDIKPHERVVNGLQSMIALTHAVALAGLILTQDQCEDTQTPYCQLALFSQLAYQSTLLATWAISEKEKETSSDTVDVSTKSNNVVVVAPNLRG